MSTTASATTVRPIPHTLQPALDLAAAGIPVFPCWNAPGNKELDKSPRCAGGHNSASTDIAQVRQWFGDGTALIGMPTGAPSGLDVLDIDTAKGGRDWLLDNGRRLPATRTYRTQSGGLHIVFRAQPGLRCSKGAIARGIDTRCDGGYVVRWDVLGGKVEVNAEPVAWPDHLLVELLRGHSGGNGEPTDIERRLPPSASAVVDLLNRMPNPLEAERDVYVRVLTAAQGCIAALGTDEGISDAAIAWAQRWPGPTCLSFEAEEAKWRDDFGTRDGTLAGWASLQRVARDLIPGYAEELAAERLAEAQQDFDALEPEPATKPAKAKFQWLDIDDVETMPDPTYLIDGILPSVGLAVMFGPAKQLKSFAILSMALHIAAGKPWFGRNVDQGAVYYICGEGAGGLKPRIKAARQHYGIRKSVPFYVLTRAAKFTDPGEIGDLIASIQDKHRASGVPVRAIIPDTLARSMAGADENTAKDMGLVVEQCDRLRDAFQCLVVPIHHTGKDVGRGMRGSYSLEGAVDCAILVTREKSAVSDVATLDNVYQKDGPEFPAIYFDAVVVPDPTGGRGSLALSERLDTPAKAKPTSPKQDAVLSAVREMAADLPPGTNKLDKAAVIERCAADGFVSNADRLVDRRAAAARHLKALVDVGIIAASGSHIWLDEPSIPLSEL